MKASEYNQRMHDNMRRRAESAETILKQIAALFSDYKDGPVIYKVKDVIKEVERLEAELDSHPDRERLIVDLRAAYTQALDDNHELASMLERERAKSEASEVDRDKFNAEVERLVLALAETEALELQHGDVIDRQKTRIAMLEMELATRRKIDAEYEPVVRNEE